MKNYTYLACIILLPSMIGCAVVQAADAQSEEQGSEPATLVSKEEPPDEDGVITNSIGMKLKLIEAGEFMMGSEKGQSQEKPVHKVKITKPFYIGVYEVTQAQYEKITGKNPSHFKGPNRPVETVSWNDAQLFCKKLSEKEGVKYRLPTEAEWEYACRAGTKTEHYWGDEMDGRYAWYSGNCERRTHDVGQKKPNAWGLYDMSGNVHEFCSDWFAMDYYDNSPEKDPQGPKDGTHRVLRGGSWGFICPCRGGTCCLLSLCRSARRFGFTLDYALYYHGFRIARAPKDAQSAEKESEPATPVSKEEPSNEDGANTNSEVGVITNSIGMKLKLIKAGEFMMGSAEGDNNMKPVHKVKRTKPFYIGVHEVTQAQYEKIMERNPSHFKGPNRPVDSVSWNDAVSFCEKLSEKEGVTYRLPTEAEWEYACRAGTKTEYYWGDVMDGRYAWDPENSEDKTHDVGQKKPNAWGLYDMSGNVREWCSDWFAEDYYDNSPEKDPQGAKDGMRRVERGGSWAGSKCTSNTCRKCRSWRRLHCRSARRSSLTPDRARYFHGFRVVRAPASADGEEGGVEISEGGIRFEYHKFLLLKTDERLIALHVLPDPARGWRGILYTWFALSDGTDNFFQTALKDIRGEYSAIVTVRNPRVSSGTGKTHEGDKDIGSGWITIGDLKIEWSQANSRAGWLYLRHLPIEVKLYPVQFQRLEDFRGKLDEAKWISNKSQTPESPDKLDRGDSR